MSLSCAERQRVNWVVGAKISEYIWSRISFGKSRTGIDILEVCRKSRLLCDLKE